MTEEADDLLCGYHLAMLRPSADTFGPYLFRSLQTQAVARQFHVEAKGVTRYGITHNAIQAVTVTPPPMEEQISIAKYIEETIFDINAAARRARRQIELMEEYRTRLIADVVTGKIDVSGT